MGEILYHFFYQATYFTYFYINNLTYTQMETYSVVMESLCCNGNREDVADSSEIYLNYIIDDGEVQRFPIYGNYKLKKGEDWKINLQLSYHSKIVFVLVQKEGSEIENDLGILTINNHVKSKKGLFTNKNKDCTYELSYQLLPLYSVELANLECCRSEAEEGYCNEIYFNYKIDNGEEQRYPTSGNYLIKQGDCCYVGLNLKFSNEVFICLKENSSLIEKNLGTIQLNPTILEGYQHFTNENEEWDYKIIYFRLNRLVSFKNIAEKQELVIQ